MASFQELAKDYAKRIKQAIASDGFKNGQKIPSPIFKKSRTLTELKAVKSEIDGLIYTKNNKPLTEDDRRKITALIHKNIGLPQIIEKRLIQLDSASNDDLSDLADEIENILSGGK